MSKVFVFDHPLIQHKLSILRDKNTSVKEFRELISEIAMLMCYECTRDLPLEDVEVETPVATAHCKRIAGKKLAIVPILRAGIGMVVRVFPLVFLDGGEAGPGRDLVQFPAVGGAVQAVQAQKTGFAGKGTARETGDELGEIGFRRVIILVAVVGKAPVELDGVVAFGPVREDGHRFEQLGGLEIFLVVEIIHRSLVLGVYVVGGKERLVFGLAGGEAGHGGCEEDNGSELHLFNQVIIGSQAGTSPHLGRPRSPTRRP